MPDKLDYIVDEWNTVYASKNDNHSHEVTREYGNFNIIESDGGAKLNRLTIKDIDGISFPSKTLESFDCWGALTNRNSDGAFLVKNKSGEFHLVLCEMKSKYDTEQIVKARAQIIETVKKLNILLNNLDSFHKTNVKTTSGIIVCNTPDDKQLMFIKNMSQLPEEKRGRHSFAIDLYLNKALKFSLPLPTDQKGKIMRPILPDEITISLKCSSKNNCSFSLEER